MRVARKQLCRAIVVATIAFSYLALSLPAAVQAETPKPLPKPITKPLPYKAPTLNCALAGEGSGEHPGWRSDAAKSITIYKYSATSWAATWCPALAPSGQGQISYTLTSSFAAATCNTTSTSCKLPLYSKTAIYYLTASDQTGSYFAPTDIAVQNPGTPYPCSPAANICDNKYQNLSFSAYGNLTGTNDCTLAAMANWQTLNLGITPDELELRADWATLSPNNQGIYANQALDYWRSSGISGVHLQAATPVTPDPLSIKLAMSSSKSLIADLVLNEGQSFAGFTLTKYTEHWVLVTGYTPQGPLVVSWGRTLQMTWQQWLQEARATWNITASS